MAISMTVSKARAALADVIDRVSAGEEVTLTRHGEPVAVVVRPDTLRARRAEEAFTRASAVRQLVDEARRTQLDDIPPLTEDRAEELVAGIRAGRAGR